MRRSSAADGAGAVVRIGAGHLGGGQARAIADVAVAGGVIVYPTETFYALGADPFDPRGVARVFALKGRPREKPLLVLVGRRDCLDRFAASVPPAYAPLMARLWPGPLTLLFPARPGLIPGIASPAGEVAVRLPGSALCRRIVEAAGGCLTGTSANAAGAPPPRAAAAGGLRGAVDLTVDAGTLPPARVSTLAGLREGRLRVLREGAAARGAVEGETK